MGTYRYGISAKKIKVAVSDFGPMEVHEPKYITKVHRDSDRYPPVKRLMTRYANQPERSPYVCFNFAVGEPVYSVMNFGNTFDDDQMTEIGFLLKVGKEWQMSMVP